MKSRFYMYGMAVAFPALMAGMPAKAATPDSTKSTLADVRLGARDGSVTRVVLDLKGGDAPFTYSVSPDGMTLTVSVDAKAGKTAVPHHGSGLVRAVESAKTGKTAQISIATAAPVSVISTGKLAPSGEYRFHRIYLDIGPSTGAPAPMAPPRPVMTAAESVASPAAIPLAPEEHQPEMAHAEMGHGGMMMEQHEEHGGHEGGHHEHEEHEEPAVTIKLGGSFERSVSDYTNSGGPTAALETGLLHDALEMELGSTALLKDGHTTWKTGLIFKKPFEITENMEFELGAGPLWFHRAYDIDEEEAQRDSAGVEGVAELVFWPGSHRSLGMYVETGYSYDFGKGHEKAAGAGAGILIPLP